MRQLTMEEIDNGNLFEEAKERYENCCSNRWKNKWWELVCNIFKRSARWATKYVVDIIKKAIYLKGTLIENDVLSFTYWIRLYNAKHETVFNKVGTSGNPLRRWEEILRERYCINNGVVGYEIRKVWTIRNDWPEGLESYLRAMLIKKHGAYYVPNDRFACELTEEEVFNLADAYLA